MTSIVELFPKARRLAYDLQTQIQFLEKGHASADDVGVSLDELEQQLKILDSLASQERPAQRENWRRKLKELVGDKDFLREQLDRYNNSRQRQGREAREREALLARRNAALPSGVVDAYAEEGSSLLRSQRMMGDYLQSGQAALASLVDQRHRLKGVQRRVLDIANVMGVSGSILRMSERREAVDRLLVLGGMVFITGLLYYAWARKGVGAGEPPAP
ncbi:soluble NSF attachment protein receptor [Tribonema minus]|uniref:Soluble NSF attachment protein receptor n=1 Tax=Tribonema minus TaxID=303371 RepID=A0A835ZDP4_9STRA|nr:soluble NSF attachment protein receptor [Tribonema minus]